MQVVSPSYHFLLERAPLNKTDNLLLQYSITNQIGQTWEKTEGANSTIGIGGPNAVSMKIKMARREQAPAAMTYRP